MEENLQIYNFAAFITMVRNSSRWVVEGNTTEYKHSGGLLGKKA